MKMKMKWIASILAAVMAMVVLGGCSEKTLSYKDDVPVSELCKVADALISDSATMAEVDNDYIKGMMNIDTASFAEYAVRVQASGANVNEYGIFKAPSNEAVAGIEDMVKEYLAMRVDTWMPEYMPEEFPKVQKATCKVMGRYIMYSILSDADRDAVFTAVENTLLGK